MNSYRRFQEISEACYVSGDGVRELYAHNPEAPWETQSDLYGPFDRCDDAETMLEEIFGQDGDLSIEQTAGRITEFRERMIAENRNIGTIRTVGNISVATARKAADAFREYLRLGIANTHERPLDIEHIRMQGKPTPYGDSKIIVAPFMHVHGQKYRGVIMPADYAATNMMYNGDMLAMVMAREYGIEEVMPEEVYKN